MNTTKALSAGLMLAAGAISGALTWGLYSYLHEKKRMSGWKAGALVGGAGAALGATALLIGWTPGEMSGVVATRLRGVTMDKVRGVTMDRVRGITMDRARGMRGFGALRVAQIPRAMAGLTVDRLSGSCIGCGM